MSAQSARRCQTSRPGDRLFTVAETAVITHSSRSTVRRQIRRGELAGIWVSPRGLRVWASNVEALLPRGSAPERKAA